MNIVIPCSTCNWTWSIAKIVKTPFGEMQSQESCPDCLEVRKNEASKKKELEQKKQIEEFLLKSELKWKKNKEKAKHILEGHKELLQKFLEITERKVSFTDDYWDENWEELTNQINIVISKIYEREWHSKKDIENRKNGDKPEELFYIEEELSSEFMEYHSKHKNPNSKNDEINKMSGIDFEIFLSKKLRELWYEVTNTPKTWDQWADLIAKKNNKIYIIQAKRYEWSVWNKAIQEVTGAVNFYSWNQWYVITNSLFTPSAKALAQKNNIILIDGHDLKSIEIFF